MLRGICVLTASVLMLFLIGCVPSKDTTVSYAEIAVPTPFHMADYDELIPQIPGLRTRPVAATLKELESYSVNIVRGTVQEGSTMIYQYPFGQENDVASGHGVVFGHTVITLEISDIYAGKLQAGDTIRIVEPYYDTTADEKRYFIYRDNFLPSTPGREYLFFLMKRTNFEPFVDTYTPVDGCLGRYPVLDLAEATNLEAYSNLELNLGEWDSSDYRAMYAEVMEKYLK